MTVMTIARYARYFIDNSLARARKTVKKRRLPDIRATNNSNKIRHGGKGTGNPGIWSFVHLAIRAFGHWVIRAGINE